MYTPVILCGGSGTRLWPLSRTAYPKQLLPLVNDKSLLQQTLLRLRDLPEVNQPIIICNQDYRFIVAEQLRDIGFSHAKIILEPEGKNTAPAVTLAALLLKEENNNDLMLVLPADHVIHDHKEFSKSVQHAAVLARENVMVTFGVVPTKPETGYGYIQKGESLGEDAYKVKQFVEKPDLVTAAQYFQLQSYFWNSGMFMFKAEVFLKEMALYAPDILDVCRLCVQQMMVDLDFYRLSPGLFKTCRSESIDYAAMEKSNNIAVVALRSDWSDVGSWSAMREIHPWNPEGNVFQGDVVAEQVSNSYLRSESRLLAAVGVSDLIVIETPDAVLVTHKDSCQYVKSLVNILKKEHRPETERHCRDYRPWGYYEVLKGDANFQVKRLVVKPGAKLSLQKHQFRSEHWVVIKGVALVTCGEKKFELKENHSTFIPAGQKHRLENITEEPLELIEVQTGSYFGEDDIVRFEDIYQREVKELQC